MVRITQLDVALGVRTQEFLCPNCGQLLKWKAHSQQSPYTCTGCRKIILDATKLIQSHVWRIAYHFGGEGAVKCNASM